MSVDSLVIHEKVAGNRDAQFHAQNQKSKYNEPKLPQGYCLYGRHPWIRLAVECDWFGGGGVKKLPFCLGTAYNVSSMEDTEISWLLC